MCVLQPRPDFLKAQIRVDLDQRQQPLRMSLDVCRPVIAAARQGGEASGFRQSLRPSNDTADTDLEKCRRAMSRKAPVNRADHTFPKIK